MSRRRVPPTLTDKRRRIAAVAAEHLDQPGVYRLAVEHDAGCPAVRSQRLANCRCDPQVRPPERLR